VAQYVLQFPQYKIAHGVVATNLLISRSSFTFLFINLNVCTIPQIVLAHTVDRVIARELHIVSVVVYACHRLI
jgi:hypothetical protein